MAKTSFKKQSFDAGKKTSASRKSIRGLKTVKNTLKKVRRSQKETVKKSGQLVRALKSSNKRKSESTRRSD